MAVFKPLKRGCKCGAKGKGEDEGGACVCPRSEHYYYKFIWRGRQYFNCCWTSLKSEAEKLESKLRTQLKGEHSASALAAMDAMRVRRRYATIGEIIKAYSDEGVKLVAEVTMRANVNALYSVIAYSKDLWTTDTRRKGIKIGTEVPDCAAIDKLESSILTGGLVKDFVRAKLDRPDINLRDAHAEHMGVVRMMQRARDVFSRQAIYEKMAMLKLPDLDGFRKASLPKVPDAKPMPVPEELFAKMEQDAEALREEQFDLYLTNLLFRQTGMRTSYVIGARGTWLMEMAGGWWLDVKNRPAEGFMLKPRTKPQRIPLSDELAALLLQRKDEPFFILPEGTKTQRIELVREVHNPWLKERIGGLGERVQGNHRLRDTVASALCTLHGVAVAQEALGHKSPVTTMKHYAELMPEVGPVLRAELSAWERLSGKLSAGKVIPFKAA